MVVSLRLSVLFKCVEVGILELGFFAVVLVEFVSEDFNVCLLSNFVDFFVKVRRIAVHLIISEFPLRKLGVPGERSWSGGVRVVDPSHVCVAFSLDVV